MQKQKKIIIFRLLDSDPGLTSFLFEEPTVLRLRSSPAEIANDTWELSNQDQILIRVALDIWSGQGNAFLWEVLKGLNQDALARLALCIASYRDLQIEMQTMSEGKHL